MSKTIKKVKPKAAATKSASASHWLEAIQALFALVQEVLALLRGMQAEQQTVVRAVTAPPPAVLAAVEAALAEVGLPPGQCEAITTSLRAKLAVR